MKHDPTEEEQRQIDALLERYDFEMVPIRLTRTMLEKSIIDAGAPLRALLKQSGLVDYAAIPPSGSSDGLVSSLPVTTPYGLEHRRTSFYRPETKQGDPRFWISNLGRLASDGDLLLMVFKGAAVIAVLLSVGHQAIVGALDQLLPLRDDRLRDIPRVIERIRCKVEALDGERWIPTLRSGDTGVGFTFETLLGLKANVRKGADIEGVELKAHRVGGKVRSDPLISLFAKTPVWWKVRGTRGLVEAFGYEDPVRGRRALYCSIDCTRNSLGWSLEVDPDEARVWVCHDGDRQVYYTFAVLEARLKEKHTDTLFIGAAARGTGREEEFRYDEVVYCSQASFAAFLELVQQGQICLDFTAHVQNGRPRDHGYLWRIRESQIPRLYAYRRQLFKRNGPGGS
jgi:hypothetical protein